VAGLRRVAVVVTCLLALSACGESVPAAVGSYRVTIVPTSSPRLQTFFVNGNSDVLSLVFSADGHYVMTPSPGHTGTTFKGTWTESDSAVALTSPQVQFVAQLQGKNLRHGHIVYVRETAPSGYTITWSAVRT